MWGAPSRPLQPHEVPGSPWPSKSEEGSTSCLEEETRRPLGSSMPPLCKSPCLSAACAPRKDDCLAPQPEQAVLKLWEHKAACPREECVAQESGARQTPSHSPLPLAASLSPHILLGPPAPHPNSSPFHHPSFQSPVFN